MEQKAIVSLPMAIAIKICIMNNKKVLYGGKQTMEPKKKDPLSKFAIGLSGFFRNRNTFHIPWI